MCGPRNFACSMCGTPWDPPDGSVNLIGPHQRKQHILLVKMKCYLIGPDETQLYDPISHPSYSPPRNTGLYQWILTCVFSSTTVCINWEIDSDCVCCFHQQLTHIDNRCRRQAGLPDLRMVAMSPLAKFNFDPRSFSEETWWLCVKTVCG